MTDIVAWFMNPAQWAGADSIPVQIGWHVLYSLIAMLIAFLIAFPLGVYIGHTGKGESVIVGLANAFRALPTLGLLIFMVLILAPRFSSRLAFVIPAMIVLVVLAIPPILNGTCQGIRSIDQSVIDAAKGMGLDGRQMVMRLEIPCAAPLIVSGMRSATLQVVSTASVAAYVSLNGLGRYIIDGRAANDYSQMAGGAILMALLAVIVDLLISWAGNAMTSPGLTRRIRERG
ncbi:ABC transporter permease [Bifidobacterium subtile]|jgi:osmoprotectant transport system permease protein|uniref:Proline/glycine betaine ABC transporter permease n=1 Tax=Bifidobacterium subtile TaxID=77635 RepID=A0A087E7Q8_9BIFI|nr:ABC transporter permease [Bifidobacterium subtile]KFJ03809.1 proline/glycine betaine ABC transporter permease [Bifidobacterium subtile]MCI1242041.1 ABC transporter permease [Bifidobacterium subtile]